MKDAVKPRRAYDSHRRREQADATRRAVLDAARELFVHGGYAGTTIVAIAARAQVSAETVYARFRNKRTILSELIDVVMAGDDAPVPAPRAPLGAGPAGRTRPRAAREHLGQEGEVDLGAHRSDL